MIDQDWILRLLRSITDDSSVLKGESGADESRRGDPMWLKGPRRGSKALGDLEEFVSQVAAFIAHT